MAERLWPWGTRSALLAGLALTAALAALAATARVWLGWPGDAAIGSVALAALLAGGVPLGLLALDFFARQRAVVDLRGVKLDFSRLAAPGGAGGEVAVVAANLGVTGPVVSDTAPMDIVAALAASADADTVVVDIRAGETWWATRLIALCAGAVRRGRPRAVVFVGMHGNRQGQFLGWAPPEAVLAALLADRDDYRERFDRAKRIAGQVALFDGGTLMPTAGAAPVMLDPAVARYAFDPRYAALGDAAFEQIVMDQFGATFPGPSLEEPPDRLTLARLTALLEPRLVRRRIDAADPPEAQADAALGAREPFVAVVRDGAFVSMLARGDAERAILAGLLAASRAG